MVQGTVDYNGGWVLLEGGDEDDDCDVDDCEEFDDDIADDLSGDLDYEEDE